MRCRLAIGLPPDEPARQRRARPWRLLTAGGGLLLASTFFMPAVPGCNEQIIPAREVYTTFADQASAPSTWVEFLGACAGIYLMFLLAYLFGLFVAVRAGMSLASGRSHSRPWVGAAMLILGCLLVLGFVVYYVATEPGISSEWVPNLISTLVTCVLLGYLLRVLWRFGPRAHLGVAFLGSVAAVVWFACWVIPGLYGVRLSMAGSVMILVGTIGEARVLTRRSWIGTIWRLGTCRLRDLPVPPDACPGCGYRLFGLREMRCPECGRAFTFGELGLTAEDLGFAGAGTPAGN